MIILSEQYGYKKPKSIAGIDRFAPFLKELSYRKSILGEDSFCFNITRIGGQESVYHFETSYFVGVDWVVENELPIYVRPKLDDSESEVNYIAMLFAILKEPGNYDHLGQLCQIDFDRPTIAIEQKQDLLTPLLLVQYLHVLKKLVQKGLKKSYYPVTKNLNARVKGKILVNETIKKNHFNNKMLFNYCEYTEFGINSTENKILKKALTFAKAALQNLNGLKVEDVFPLVHYIEPAFVQVDNVVNIEQLKSIRPNRLYKEYEQALKLAKHILKRYGYNISRTTSDKVHTPPFWIDMSKLFEFYVFAKLKERFSQHNEVTYHKMFNYLEPDFIVRSNDGMHKMVVDAKYKPYYENNRVKIEDIRQVSGYARLEKVYKFMGIKEDAVIDCLVIYSSQTSRRMDFTNDNFVLESEPEYKRFFKIGIALPTQQTPR